MPKLNYLLRKVGFVAGGRGPVIGKLKSPPLHAWLHALCRSDDTVQTLARRVANFDTGTRCVRVSETACRELDRYNVWGELPWLYLLKNTTIGLTNVVVLL